MIAVGEMRDIETIATALTAAETGHLVLATLHTPDAVQTVQRMLGAFPPEQQNNIAYQVAGSLQAIIAQNLLPRADGNGQVLVCEICIATPAIRKMIRDGESHLMTNEIQMGKKFQMQTMDIALVGSVSAWRNQLRHGGFMRERRKCVQAQERLIPPSWRLGGDFRHHPIAGGCRVVGVCLDRNAKHFSG